MVGIQYTFLLGRLGLFSGANLLLVSGRVLTLTYLLRCEILASQVATSPDSPEVSLSVIASMLPEKVTRPGRDLCGIPEPVARRP